MNLIDVYASDLPTTSHIIIINVRVKHMDYNFELAEDAYIYHTSLPALPYQRISFARWMGLKVDYTARSISPIFPPALRYVTIQPHI